MKLTEYTHKAVAFGSAGIVVGMIIAYFMPWILAGAIYGAFIGLLMCGSEDNIPYWASFGFMGFGAGAVAEAFLPKEVFMLLFLALAVVAGYFFTKKYPLPEGTVS